MFYTLTCPNCKVLEQMINSVLPNYSSRFEFKRVLAGSPMGYIRTLKLGIHSVPTLLIDGKIEFRGVPTREQLIDKLNNYTKSINYERN
ncbi:thioredoxin family protein [Tenuifilum thalassicum]|uniref:Thioredoxin family protein n=2 Tax=Tenuifilum thalassicum TaxID=2590900 RepID=A0A7D3XIT5_9BACT|nr:thioredoxin family protein [Tenuifilum thalassicum]